MVWTVADTREGQGGFEPPIPPPPPIILTCKNNGTKYHNLCCLGASGTRKHTNEFDMPSLNSYFQNWNSYFQSLNSYFETVADI